MNNIILEDNLDLNLSIVPTTCCVVIILENQSLARREFLADLSWKSIRGFLVGV